MIFKKEKTKDEFNNFQRREVRIKVVGPIDRHDDYFGCRRCGGRPEIWIISGIGKDGGATYWECEDCGLGEVVRGTPMNFGEPILSQEMYDKITPLCYQNYIAYRLFRGMKIPRPFIVKAKASPTDWYKIFHWVKTHHDTPLNKIPRKENEAP